MTRPLTMLTALLLVGAALLFVPLAKATPGWVAPASVTPPGLTVSEPQVAIDDAGDAVAIWLDRVEGKDVVEGAIRPVGGDWTQPVELSARGQSASHEQLAMDSAGEAVAVWQVLGQTAITSSIEAATATVAGGWSASKPLPTGSAAALTAPDVAIDQTGEAVAIWVRTEGVSSRLEGSSRAPHGEWSTPKFISHEPSNVPGSFNASEPELAIDAGGDAAAVWRSERVSIEANVRPSGMEWGTAKPIAPVGTQPQVAIDPEGEAFAVWSQSTTRVVEAASLPVGGEWSTGTPLSVSGGPADTPQIASAAPGETLAVWRRSDGQHTIVETAVHTAAAGWSPAKALSKAGVDATLPQVAANPVGEAVAVWVGDGTNDDIEAARRDAGAEWSSATLVSEPGEQGLQPEVAIDAAGEAIAGWAGNGIKASAFDQLGPDVSNISIPGNGTVGVPVTLAASARDNWSALGQAAWDFGDGSSGTGLATAHTFTAPGTYRIALTSADALGNQTTASGSITISGLPPGLLGQPRPAPRYAKAARILTLQGHVAMLRLSCPPPVAGSCSGVAKLTAKVGKKKLTVAQGSFSVPGGQSATVKLKAARRKPVSAFLASLPAKGAKASLSGQGLAASSVLLKPKRAKHGHR